MENSLLNPIRLFNKVLPKGTGTLFFIQIFSTLSFSVLYSTLVLYLTHALKLSDTFSTGIIASFLAFNFALHLLGGYIGGRFFSYRVLFSIGMVFQIAGCILLTYSTLYVLFWALAAFLVGSGLNITCINCMLTQLFTPQDHTRETAFLWNYSGMNIGFFVGFSMSGYFQLSENYSQLFLLSSLGNGIALILIFLKWPFLADRRTKLLYYKPLQRQWAYFQGIGIILLLFFGLRSLLQHAQLNNQVIMFTGAVMILFFCLVALKQPKGQQGKIWAFIVLALTSLVFWTLYQLSPMALTLFIERNVDRHFLNGMIAPQWVQNINTVVIILGGPILSIVFQHLRDRGFNITIPVQFSFALVLIGIAFAILPMGIHFANAQGYSHFNWILVSYILQSVGELFISPIGYAMIGQLAPERLQGLMMGTWLMITGVAATLSGFFSNMALKAMPSMDPLSTNSIFSHTFNVLGWSAIATGIVLYFLIPFLVRLIEEKAFFHKQKMVSTEA